MADISLPVIWRGKFEDDFSKFGESDVITGFGSGHKLVVQMEGTHRIRQLTKVHFQ